MPRDNAQGCGAAPSRGTIGAMKTLIIYATHHGCAERAAHLIAKELPGETVVCDIDKDPKVEIDAFETIVVGGSIHAGRVQRKVTRFVNANLAALAQKRLGLFLCCMYEGDKAKRQLEAAFPAELCAKAAALGLFGGAFDFDKMNFVERAVVKKVAGVGASVSTFDEEKVVRFAAAL